MSLTKSVRLIHRWGTLLITIPLFIIILTGLLLMVKKEFTWVQPETMRGTETIPSISFNQILQAAKSVKQTKISSWDDIDRLDVRPSKGVVKIRTKSRWEIQIDTATAEVLQVAYRRSDLIESIHDGSFFGDGAKYWLFIPSAILLLIMLLSGVYLFGIYGVRKLNSKSQR